MDATSLTARLLRMSPAQVRRMLAQKTTSRVGWVSLLAAEGIAQAQTCYGQMLLDGSDAIKNERAALTWFKRAADQGDVEAINMVGRCLENGWGCATDVAQAAAYYHRAGDAGHAWAQYNLGHLYLDGLGVLRDVDRAYRYYLMAATQDHARAMNLVGRCCEEGWGTPKDVVAASDWYRRSAERGYFRGQYNWATTLLASGRSEEALAWLERAAAAGTPGVREAAERFAAHVVRIGRANVATIALADCA